MEHELKDRITKAEEEFGITRLPDPNNKKRRKKKKYYFSYTTRGIDGEMQEHNIFIYAYEESEARLKLRNLGYDVYSKKNLGYRGYKRKRR